MSSLFDEDSSSDEELTKSQTAPPKQKNSDDDDDDDNDDDMKVADDAEDTPKRTIEVDEEDDDDDDDKPAKKPSAEENEDEDDGDEKGKVVYNPDEEDVEYDGDRDGIVGSAAPIKSASDAPKVSRRPKKMTVMESTRPPKDTTLHITKLPNLVGIQPEPFDEAAYSPELEEKEYNGYVHNMIRWRYKKDASGNFVRNDAGKLMRESNARLVKWDDGSITLNIGSEVLAVDSLETATGGYPGLNGYLYLSQKATFPTENGDEEKEAGGTVLECMGGITSKFTARPSSLQSEAHKALTVAVRQKTVKRAKIAEYVTQEDPEKMKEEKIRLKTDLNKSEARKSAGRNYGGGRRPGMNRRYMEDEDDGHYDSVNIKDLKRRQFADDEMMDYGDDSDEDDDDDDVGWSSKGGRPTAKRASKKRQRQEEDDDEEEEFGAGDESDEEEVARGNKSAKKRQTNLFDDDDD